MVGITRSEIFFWFGNKHKPWKNTDSKQTKLLVYGLEEPECGDLMELYEIVMI